MTDRELRDVGRLVASIAIDNAHVPLIMGVPAGLMTCHCGDAAVPTRAP